MSTRIKDTLLEQFAAVAKAVGHRHRFSLLEHLAQGERTVEGLADRTGLSVANVSQHLQTMRRSGLLVARRDGKFVLYRLADDSVLSLMHAIHRVAERNMAEVEGIVRGYFHERDAMEPVSRNELRKRMKDGLVMVLDVRPAEEFAIGHIPGAVNIPVSELKRRLAELPKKQEVVAYCRGPFCVMAFEAVSLLREHGFKSRRLEDGMPEWRAAGLPMAAVS
jgi:rhodanese-related sulfurtransferase/DNA-binding transcriptional ArsR family regulator